MSSDRLFQNGKMGNHIVKDTAKQHHAYTITAPMS